MDDMIKMALKQIMKGVGGMSSERRVKGPAVMVIKKTEKPVVEEEGEKPFDLKDIFSGEEEDEEKEEVGKDIDPDLIEKLLEKRKKGG